ncbi:multidrug effflux MFS transporter [Pseudomonas sp. 8O]|uniref:multidrug effflux MFS transporter n=1 Tax=Pseudomonas sp. 8O TaxID=2653165 RepID=UPI0012F1EF5E|nr:multidrug effflux MFS transporter [Pseudomonas sp. 8O]VXB17718.1 DHA1 family bicyclomycin/chloramphenicol resistance-like MFS transporter [Pseudomonas sp. 8O]
MNGVRIEVPKPAHDRGSPSVRGILPLLAALAAIGALSTNIILPLFPIIAADLGASSVELGLTLSVFFAVFALGQLVVGPLSDSYGRRKLIVGGLLVFCVGGVVCAQATDVSMLVLGRAIQAAGVCAASVLARALARDLFEGEALARVLAMIMVAMAAAPGFSPLLGSAAEKFIGWRMTFMGVSSLGLALVFWYAMRLAETHSTSRRTPLSATSIFKGYGKLLLDARFVGPAVVVACVTGGLFGFFTAAPVILLEGLGLSSLGFGVFFAGTVLVVFAAGLLGPRIAHYLGTERTVYIGLFVALAGGFLVWAAAACNPGDLITFAAAISVFLFGMGMVNPLSTALALVPFAAQAGSASAMLGFLQMSGAALGAALVTALSHYVPMTALGLILMAAQVIAIAVFGLLRARRSAIETG